MVMKLKGLVGSKKNGKSVVKPSAKSMVKSVVKSSADSMDCAAMFRQYNYELLQDYLRDERKEDKKNLDEFYKEYL